MPLLQLVSYEFFPPNFIHHSFNKLFNSGDFSNYKLGGLSFFIYIHGAQTALFFCGVLLLFAFLSFFSL